MPEWQSDFTRANGIRVHFTRTGGDKPPLVLAHGYSDDGLCWTPVARALEPEFDVVMVDARGHGRSEAPHQDNDPTTLAGDLAGVITGLGLRQPIILGHSMGAMTAMILASLHPALPRAIALEDPPAWWAVDYPRPFGETWVQQSRASIVGLQAQSRQALIDAQRAEAPRWSAEELEPWADAKLRLSLNFFEHLHPLDLDPQSVLPRITCPVLLITGDPALGAIVTDRRAEALRELVPQVRRAHIPGAGHSIRRDQLELYLTAAGVQLKEWTDHG